MLRLCGQTVTRNRSRCGVVPVVVTVIFVANVVMSAAVVVVGAVVGAVVVSVVRVGVWVIVAAVGVAVVVADADPPIGEVILSIKPLVVEISC